MRPIQALRQYDDSSDTITTASRCTRKNFKRFATQKSCTPLSSKLSRQFERLKCSLRRISACVDADQHSPSNTVDRSPNTRDTIASRPDNWSMLINGYRLYTNGKNSKTPPVADATLLPSIWSPCQFEFKEALRVMRKMITVNFGLAAQWRKLCEFGCSTMTWLAKKHRWCFASYHLRL